MLVTSLPYPGVLVAGNKLRRDAAKSLNIVEDTVRANKGKATPQVAKLAAFFQACATAAANLAKPTA